jgi:hypothetical protein
MRSNRKGLLRRSPLAAVLVVLILGGAATAFAVSGIAATGDDGSATGKTAQQPLGDRSATPGRNDLLGQEPTGQSLGTGQVSPNSGSGRPVVTGSGGGGGGSLPFTGFLALGVLLSGVVLLAAGLVVRRRSSQSATA